MTEIPEHLLRRSRERRAALGLGGDEAGAPAAAAPASGSSAEVAPATGPASAGEPAGAVAAAAGTAVETAPPGGVVAVEEPAPPPYVAPTGPHKSKVPLWVMPVLIALPLWAFLYPSAFASHKKSSAPTDPYAIGNTVFHSAGCSGCHGAAGEGGVGPRLAGGQAKLTFPNIQDQISWVNTGSAPFTGKKYGDPNRAGGQHGPATGGMPAFGGTLSPAQIQDVVMYERDKL